LVRSISSGKSKGANQKNYLLHGGFRVVRLRRAEAIGLFAGLKRGRWAGKRRRGFWEISAKVNGNAQEKRKVCS